MRYRTPVIHDSRVMSAKKEESKQKMIERYLGKKDLLAEWDLYPDIDRDYRNDLKQRVHHHYQSLVYRGVGEYEETKGGET